MALPLELTLVLAATRQMGIGQNGSLPWTGLKKEMAYFARVTKRLPPTTQPLALNAVIMGRKTWDSIPPKFRPLKGRLNMVLSRSAAAPPSAAAGDTGEGPVEAPSLDAALAYLGSRPSGSVGHVFVIGGAQIYEAAVRRPEARRVLLTRVRGDFACDTFVSLPLGEGEGKEEGSTTAAAAEVGRWAKSGLADLSAWVGEEVPAGVQTENGTDYEFEMWERVD